MYINGPKVNQENCQWLAGLLEGEGCFYFKGTPKILLSMSDEDIVARVAELFGSTYNKQSPHGIGKKYMFNTSVCGIGAIEIMNILLPYMGLRRTAKIKEVLEKADARPGIAIGERAGPSKLTDEQANLIRKAYIPQRRKTFGSSSWLAKKFGVSQAAIWYVINRRLA